MVCDSQSTKPSSSMVGTSEFGFIFRYSGVLVTPNCMPASTRSYLRPSSSTHHSAFFTLTELVRPQILSMSPHVFRFSEMVPSLAQNGDAQAAQQSHRG